MGKYLSDKNNLLELVGHMPNKQRVQWIDFGHLELIPCFVGRVLVLYKVKTTRLAEVQTLIDVKGACFNESEGLIIRLEDRRLNDEMEVYMTPQKLFGYPVYVNTPTRCELRMDAHVEDGKVVRQLSYTMLVKTRNKPVFSNVGNYYLTTPNKFRELFPLQEVDI